MLTGLAELLGMSHGDRAEDRAGREDGEGPASGNGVFESRSQAE